MHYKLHCKCSLQAFDQTCAVLDKPATSAEFSVVHVVCTERWTAAFRADALTYAHVIEAEVAIVDAVIAEFGADVAWMTSWVQQLLNNFI